MKPVSLFEFNIYSTAWIKDFYTQAGEWWGEYPQAPGVHSTRVKTVERLCGNGSKRILELGAGPGVSAAALAEAGHNVVAVEFSPSRAEYARELTKISCKGSLIILEGDFYSLELAERFDVVCCWETFGLGSDADQRRLLQRIAHEWLGPGGCLLMDVYSPFRLARDAGTEQRLPPILSHFWRLHSGCSNHTSLNRQRLTTHSSSIVTSLLLFHSPKNNMGHDVRKPHTHLQSADKSNLSCRSETIELPHFI